MFERIRKGVLGAVLRALLVASTVPGATAAGEAAVQTPPAGLMWNRSGLPAVFPLQVKTRPGKDYRLTLIESGTSKAVLAAYIEGGSFFKVLVPPGTFRLRFAAGTVWRGEEDLFGPEAATEIFELRKPLTFETRGLGIKAGHAVDLRSRGPGRTAAIDVDDQMLCQSFRPQFPAPEATFPERPVRRYAERHALPDDTPMRDFDGHRIEAPRYRTPSQIDVRSRFCG